MFDFSTPESSLQMLFDHIRASGDGPGVAEVPLDEQTEEELTNSLIYCFGIARIAIQEYNKEVQALAMAAFNEVWKLKIEHDPEFVKLFLSGKATVPTNDRKPYLDYVRGKTSEL
jgi:hypothetical protein